MVSDKLLPSSNNVSILLGLHLLNSEYHKIPITWEGAAIQIHAHEFGHIAQFNYFGVMLVTLMELQADALAGCVMAHHFIMDTMNNMDLSYLQAMHRAHQKTGDFLPMRLPFTRVRFWPILLKKSVFQNAVGWTGESASSARFYVKSQPERLWRTFRISISDAYFSALENTADFFNRIGRFLPVATGSYWLLQSFSAWLTHSHGVAPADTHQLQTAGQRESK
ncbi:hypothetical protein [Pseudomonas silesiensis]